MPALVIFGASNILSDLFDAAMSNGLELGKVVIDEPEAAGDRDIPAATRIKAVAAFARPPELIQLDDFQPQADELYLLGPTTPTREKLAKHLVHHWNMKFHTLVHPSAYVSKMATLGEGVFVGANSTIAPGAKLASHVFVNRGVTIGHDTRIGEFSRIQPGANLGGLSLIGRGVTIGIGATVLERLEVGDNAVIAGGAVVLQDVNSLTMVAGVPASIRKRYGAVS